MGGMSEYSNVDFRFFCNIICQETCWPLDNGFVSNNYPHSIRYSLTDLNIIWGWGLRCIEVGEGGGAGNDHSGSQAFPQPLGLKATGPPPASSVENQKLSWDLEPESPEPISWSVENPGNSSLHSTWRPGWAHHKNAGVSTECTLYSVRIFRAFSDSRVGWSSVNIKPNLVNFSWVNNCQHVSHLTSKRLSENL